MPWFKLFKFDSLKWVTWIYSVNCNWWWSSSHHHTTTAPKPLAKTKPATIFFFFHTPVDHLVDWKKKKRKRKNRPCVLVLGSYLSHDVTNLEFFFFFKKKREKLWRSKNSVGPGRTVREGSCNWTTWIVYCTFLNFKLSCVQPSTISHATRSC